MKTIKLYCTGWALAVLWGAWSNDMTPRWIPREVYRTQAMCERTLAADIAAEQKKDVKTPLACLPIEMFLPK